MSDVLVLSHADVHAALAPEACERAMAEVLIAQSTGAAYAPLRNVMMPPGAPGFMGLMPAYAATISDGGFALKAICLMPGNPARGLDAHQGIVTLFDGDTGIPTAILNASAVTEIRTAAVTAVATRRLAREDSTVLTILGSGVQARAHLRALRDVRDWEQVRLFSPTAAASAGARRRPAGGAADHRRRQRPRRSGGRRRRRDRDELQGAGARARLAQRHRPRQRGRREFPGCARARARDGRRGRAVLRQPRVGSQRGAGVPAGGGRRRDRRRAAHPRRTRRGAGGRRRRSHTRRWTDAVPLARDRRRGPGRGHAGGADR